jgi:hypothetical protein
MMGEKIILIDNLNLIVYNFFNFSVKEKKKIIDYNI